MEQGREKTPQHSEGDRFSSSSKTPQEFTQRPRGDVIRGGDSKTTGSVALKLFPVSYS